jgi:hypothetical protein
MFTLTLPVSHIIARFPATLALRNNFGLVFVQHDLRGKKLGHACNGGGEKRGGTFNYCCQGGNTVDGENWFEVSLRIFITFENRKYIACFYFGNALLAWNVCLNGEWED